MTDDAPGREVLPIPDTPFEGDVPLDAREATFPPIEPLQATGGRSQRPDRPARRRRVRRVERVRRTGRYAYAERLAGAGLKYNRFHTTALCAPTRAALLSGRNHHTVGMGVITELATSAPGYNSLRPNTCAPLAKTLTLNGYSTAQFGKCHEVPVWQTSPMGPVRRLAEQGWRLRVLLRLHRRRDQPVLPGDLRGDQPHRAGEDA
jgi:arylsulfatase